MADQFLDVGALFDRARDAVLATMQEPERGYSLTDVVATEDEAAVVFSNFISAQTLIQGTFCGAVQAMKERAIFATRVEQTRLAEDPRMHVRLDELEAARSNLAEALRAGGSDAAASNVILAWLSGRLPFSDGRAATAVPLAIVHVAALAIDDQGGFQR